MLTIFPWPRSCSLPGKIVKGSFMVKENFAKYLINTSHLLNIILPKPCQIFANYFSFVQYYSAKTWPNSGNVGRMIYFRENSIISSPGYKGYKGMRRMHGEHGTQGRYRGCRWSRVGWVGGWLGDWVMVNVSARSSRGHGHRRVQRCRSTRGTSQW